MECRDIVSDTSFTVSFGWEEGLSEKNGRVYGCFPSYRRQRLVKGEEVVDRLEQIYVRYTRTIKFP